MVKVYLLLADSQADETDALYGLAAQQPELLLHGVFYNVFERGHEHVVIWHKLLLCGVGHWGDGCHHLLQHQLRALLDQLKVEEMICMKQTTHTHRLCECTVSSNTLLYLLQLGNHDDMKVLHQVVQIKDEQRFRTVLCKVYEGGGGMGLHPRVTLVLHGLQQGWDHLKRINKLSL